MHRQVIARTSCRVCHNKKIVKVIDLGSTPAANAFLTKKQLNKLEPIFPLQVFFCSRCGQLQLGHVVAPELLFRNYVYASSTSATFRNHFVGYAQKIYQRFKLTVNSLVVDIGSNDGILLKPFKQYGLKVLGIDPARRIARQATKEGIPTWPEFFDSQVAKKIVEKFGPAQIVTANNVFAHVDNLSELIKGIKILLAKDGVFVIEVPYLANLIKKNLFDTIYHEHLSYFSLRPLIKLFSLQKMMVFDVERVSSHGGSIRVFTQSINSPRQVSDRVKSLLSLEKKMGLNKKLTYVKLAQIINQNRMRLKNIIDKLISQDKQIIGYGAPAKGNTLLNYFKIDKHILKYIVDDSSYKQGLFTPGTHIQVANPNRIVKDKPDYILILAWNFANEIMEKLHWFKKTGGKFIIPIPRPKVV